MRRSYKTEGIIIKRVNFGEADRILTIFTKHYGRIKAIAKGVRRIVSRKAGNLELFNQVILFLSMGKNWDIITDVEVVNNFAKQRQELDWVGQAFQIAEVVDKLTAEREENRRVFKLLKNALGNLDKEVVVQFEIDLLGELGFGTPKDKSEKSVVHFIENIIEKRLKSKRIW